MAWLVVWMSGTAGWSAEAPLWQRAMSDLTKSPHYWACAVASTMTVYDGDNQRLGAVESRRELELQAGRPVWKETSRKRTGEPGMVITMDLGLQQDSRDVLKDYTEWVLLRTDVVEQVAVEVWQGKLVAEPGNVVVANLEPGTARPRRLQFTFPYHSMLGTMQVSVDVDYAVGPDGAWLPRRATVDQSGRFLFRKRRIQIENNYEDWRRADPAAPAPVKAS